MQNITNILTSLTSFLDQSKYKNLNISHIPNIAWSQDQVEILASIDTWTTDMGNRGSNPRESIVGKNFEHLRRLRYMYGGLKYSEILHLSKVAKTIKGSWAHNFIALLERRLDVVVWRALWANSPKQARLIIKSGHITVNGKVCKQSSYAINPGDLVCLKKEVRAIYQHRLIENWSHIPTYRIANMPMSTNEKSISVLDIMQRALCHGKLIDNNEMQLGYVNMVTPKTRNMKSLTGVNKTAEDVLSFLNNNKELNKNIWTCVLRGVSLEYSDKTSNIFPCIMPHIEVNYINMSLIYLYTPQRVLWTSLIDLESLQTHLT